MNLKKLSLEIITSWLLSVLVCSQKKNKINVFIVFLQLVS